VTSPNPNSPTLEEAVRERVAERAELWFPDVGPRPDVGLRPLVTRPRAALYAVHVGADPRPRILAKVRRGWPGGEDGRWAGSRPRLVSHPLPAADQVALEYSGLRAIHAMIDPADPRFRAVRPLDHLVEQDTLLMEYVVAPTLRQLLAGESRLTLLRGRSGQPTADETWRRVGAWLRLFQQAIPTTGLPPRQGTRQEVVERFGAYEEFFRSGPAGRSLAAVARRGADLAAEVLPERLVMAVGHGDFAPRNVFVHEDGRVSVFDPLPRWAVPRLEDLARFLVTVRLSGVQVYSHGAAYGRAVLDDRERQVLEGFGTQALCMAELRCLQLLVTLDSWSAVVDASATSWRGRLRQAPVRAAGRVVRREGARLLHLAHTAEA
jgi:hypothetical protein